MYKKVIVKNKKSEIEAYREIHFKELKDIAKRYGVEWTTARTTASHILRKTSNSTTIDRVLSCLETICCYGVLLRKGLYIGEDVEI